MKTEDGPEDQKEPSWLGLAGRVALKVVDGTLDWRIVMILCGTLLGYVALLPPEERKHVRVSDFLGLLEPGAAVWPLLCAVLTCVLAVVLFVAFVIIRVQQRRLHEQGVELAELRELHHDPDRLSSDDLDGLMRYAADQRQKMLRNEDV